MKYFFRQLAGRQDMTTESDGCIDNALDKWSTQATASEAASRAFKYLWSNLIDEQPSRSKSR